MKTTDGKNVEARLKIHLLQGKSITHNEALRLFGTNRLAEYVRRLREDGMPVITEKVNQGRVNSYGRYYLKPKAKVDRIKSREYMNQV